MSSSREGPPAESGEPSSRRNRDETTRRLVEAAAAEFLAHGYKGAAVAAVARRAGVTVGAIYARWASKSEVMAAAVDHVLGQLLPETRIEGLGLTGLALPEVFSGWAEALLDTSNPQQDVFIQVFSAAREDAEVHASLKRYLDELGDQMGRLVERSKDEGTCDPEISSAAAALLISAVGVGARLVLSAGIDGRHVPTGGEWSELMKRVNDSLNPPADHPQ